MNTTALKRQVELALADRVVDVFDRRENRPHERLTTGVADLDRVLHGFPRGAITEVHGEASSGRTSLLISALAAATAHEESCALVDCNDTFDLSSATKSGVDFERVLWMRCSHNLERAFRAVDLVLHAGGFGFVALDLCDVPAKAVRRVISSWWFRFRRALEDTPTALIVLTPIAAVRSCASLALEMKNERAVWPNTLSLISENGNGRVTDNSEQGGHLSLVTTFVPQLCRDSRLTHSHFLQAMQISVNRERPVEWSPNVVKFQPH